MITPGGFRMSVAMTNCGKAGWVSDRKGYRYDPIDPDSGAPWPAMPAAFLDLAARAAAGANSTPVLIFVHGGAFTDGEKDRTAQIYSNVPRWFARQGVLAIPREALRKVVGALER